MNIVLFIIGLIVAAIALAVLFRIVFGFEIASACLDGLGEVVEAISEIDFGDINLGGD